MKFKKQLFSVLFSVVLLCFYTQGVDKGAAAKTAATPGGGTIGIKLFTDGLLVVGLADIPTDGGKISPAKREGIEKGDVLTHINGVRIDSASEFSKTVQNIKNEPVTLTVLKKSCEVQKKLTPVLYPETGEYKLGMWVRDSAAGIGTVTFIMSDGSFGALGHGISDIDTGDILQIKSGEIVGNKVLSVLKGTKGEAGELRGMFTSASAGTVYSNCDFGIFGTFSRTPISSPELEFGGAEEISVGEARIRSTVEGEKIEEFAIQIEKIQGRNKNGQNMIIKVTDPRLLQKTGGIVQGMSGSPIIQNGKIIGAVTHVFLDDPTRGYGIFIENMLEKINNP